MFRKLAIALGAATAIAAAALTPTAASAHWHGGHWGHGFGIGFYGPTYVGGPDCYLVRRHVQFADGSWHWRRFTVCN
ncbi:MAG TPA: hypothetical protein VGC38_02880 [Pseudolabrys sp.]